MNTLTHLHISDWLKSTYYMGEKCVHYSVIAQQELDLFYSTYFWVMELLNQSTLCSFIKSSSSSSSSSSLSYLRHHEISKLYILRPVSLNLKKLFLPFHLCLGRPTSHLPRGSYRDDCSPLVSGDSSSSSHAIIYLQM